MLALLDEDKVIFSYPNRSSIYFSYIMFARHYKVLPGLNIIRPYHEN